MTVDPEIRGLVQSEVEQALRRLVQAQALTTPTPVILLRPGSVESFTPGTQAATVLVDGDDVTAIPVQNITGVNLTAGQRVMVLFQRPHGAYVIGFAAPP